MTSRMEDTATQPQTVDEAREAVVRSRERISSTLDQLEGRIVEKKHELRDKADVLAPVRQRVVRRPFTAVAVAVGVGALLGSLGSRSGEGGSAVRFRPGQREGMLDEADRAELRKWRRARQERLRARARHSEAEDHDEAPSRMNGLKHQLMGAVTTAIGAAITTKVREMTAGGADDNGRRYRAG